jgi:Tol biopolymer transport system component
VQPTSAETDDPVTPIPPVPTAGITPTATPTPAIAMPTPNPVSASASELSGLILNGVNGGELGIIQPDGSLKSILNRQITNVSPDLEQGIEENNGDLWLYNLKTSSLLRLTMTDDREEGLSAWWPNHLENILFTSRVKNQPADVHYLSTIRSDGTNYRVLDQDHPITGWPVPSPDGVWVAYSSNGLGWLWGGEAGPQQVDPASYGLSSPKGQSIFNPTWSPDASKLAWTWTSLLNVGERMGIVVFDLEKKTYQISHLFAPLTEEEPGAAALWSPDGQWLAYQINSSEPAESGTWLMSMNGSGQEIHMTGDGYRPVAWKPDSTQLVIYQQQTGAFALWLLTMNTWDFRNAEIKVDPFTQVLGWK